MPKPVLRALYASSLQMVAHCARQRVALGSAAPSLAPSLTAASASDGDDASDEANGRTPHSSTSAPAAVPALQSVFQTAQRKTRPPMTELPAPPWQARGGDTGTDDWLSQDVVADDARVAIPPWEETSPEGPPWLFADQHLDIGSMLHTFEGVLCSIEEEVVLAAEAAGAAGAARGQRGAGQEGQDGERETERETERARSSVLRRIVRGVVRPQFERRAATSAPAEDEDGGPHPHEPPHDQDALSTAGVLALSGYGRTAKPTVLGGGGGAVNALGDEWVDGFCVATKEGITGEEKARLEKVAVAFAEAMKGEEDEEEDEEERGEEGVWGELRGSGSVSGGGAVNAVDEFGMTVEEKFTMHDQVEVLGSIDDSMEGDFDHFNDDDDGDGNGDDHMYVQGDTVWTAESIFLLHLLEELQVRIT